MFIHPHVPTSKAEDGIFYHAVINFLAKTGTASPIIFPLIVFSFLYLQAIFLNSFINNQRMLSKATFFPGMAYLLITSLFPEWNYFSAPLLVNTIVLFILTSLFGIYNKQSVKGTVFNIGLGLGIASYIFFPTITFVVWVLLALAVMRPFRLNEWVICLVGIITPYYFYAIYLFFVGDLSWKTVLPYFSVSLPTLKQSIWLAGSTFLLVIPFLTGGYFIQDNLRRMLIQVRKGWSLLLLYLLGAIFVPFVNSSGTLENWIMAAIPFASFHACTYLYSSLRIYPVIIFWLTVAFILSYQYAGPGW